MERRRGAVLIADVDVECRDLLSSTLRRVGYSTFDVESGAEVLAAVRSEMPALVLLELQLPDISGYELCRELRDSYGEDLVIFLMSGDKTDAIDRTAGLLVGADDFIVKPFDADELLARVRRWVAKAETMPMTEETALQRLTAREHSVLRLLAEGRNQKEIAKDLSISGKTVATHIQHILAKFGAHSRAELVARALQARAL